MLSFSTESLLALAGFLFIPNYSKVKRRTQCLRQIHCLRHGRQLPEQPLPALIAGSAGELAAATAHVRTGAGWLRRCVRSQRERRGSVL